MVRYSIARFEDYTRWERAALLLNDPDAYMALLGPDELYLILDGLAKAKPYIPPPDTEETWRKMLRK